MPRKAQTEIPGTEQPIHKDVVRKARELFDVREQCMDLSKQEGTLAGELIALMKKHGIERYVEDDMVVEIVKAEEKVKVKVHSGDDE